MTVNQEDLVITALRKLGGKGGTPQDIDKIGQNLENWPTKNALYRILNSGKDKKFKKDGKVWTYIGENTMPQKKTLSKNPKDKADERGLYLITLSENVISSKAGPGMHFKVGSTDGDVYTRIRSYDATLPVNTIKVLKFYTLDFEDKVLRNAEKLVKKKLLKIKTLIGSNTNNRQTEWLQISMFKPGNAEDELKLTSIVDKIIKETVEELKKETTKVS